MLLIRVITLTLIVLTNIIASASEYDCQQAIRLTQECTMCKQKNTCNSYHASNCPRIPNYQKKCKDFLTKSLEEQKQKDNMPIPENNPFPIEQNNQRNTLGSDLNAVIPDVPKPAPGMENEVPKKSQELTPPPSSFIMRSWY